jgi:hypothetical protein
MLDLILFVYAVCAAPRLHAATEHPREPGQRMGDWEIEGCSLAVNFRSGAQGVAR